ncbi:helix-turn-helix domain-containing protein [Leifsonia sp. NPDC077715]|uniref:TetR/AcrR family transcriptional regulator n=1 Tax=Leifsonia sp. NPDC077715 TaxID=3155539 RepID=UPI003447818A
MTSQQRPMRADAVRNRARILDAARSQIAEHGPDAGMDEIAAAAGVAVGTLYRHFPTKTDLVAAVVAEYTEQLTVEAQAALARAKSQGRPLHELTRFLLEVIRVSAMNEAVKSAAPALGTASVGDDTRAAAALSELIALGIDAGTVRSDLTVDDIYALVLAAPLDQPDAVRQRWAQLVLPGLTAIAATIDLDAESPL